MKKLSTKNIALLGVLLTLALLIGTIEAMLPPIVPALPFFHIGLSNVIILFSVITLGYFKTAIIVVAKSFLVPIFAMNPIMFLYSLPSAILSFTLMFFLIKLKKLGLPTISFFAAFLHNLTQVGVACLMTGSTAVLYYLPYLLVVGGASGIVVGALVFLLLRALPKKLFD